MIGYLKGKVLYSEEGAVLLEVNGVGYELVCSGALFAKLVTDGEGEAYTYLQVREDGVTLFGFVSPEEKRMFLKLVSVSGVGPKMGIAVLSAMNINDLAVAIATSDLKMLSSVKGLGKKTAERIVLELREKVSAAELTAPAKGKGAAQAPAEKLTDKEEDAVVGLMSLGYTRAESSRAVKAAMEKGAETLEEIVMAALRSM
ncbi:MAG TPA: Holliday junction branch migration protein RuvA [Candidatus Borkfalkia avicola]|uniref:Holliday junction branch migration complex subunit RuvA n=1 Tax=Candidatus Borkfalkia avicola TaxID=2838503 RepID=A0A9D2IIH8_9FIRM|nr:Holliday junction branch migration protein RuvA [Candidatus Borkfalkia avicola]